MKKKLTSIAVFCGSSTGNDPKIKQQAYNLGKMLAEKNIALIYGGSKLGLMGEVAQGVLDHQGKTIGVIPGFLKTKEVAHPGLAEMHVTETMHERKLKMHDLSDAMIALPGGFGTMEEFFEILTWAQLGLHRKPIGLLNSANFYDDLLRLFEKMITLDLLKKSNLKLLCISDNNEVLLQKIKDYQPQSVPKWLHKDQT